MFEIVNTPNADDTLFLQARAALEEHKTTLYNDHIRDIVENAKQDPKKFWKSSIKNVSRIICHYNSNLIPALRPPTPK